MGNSPDVLQERTFQYCRHGIDNTTPVTYWFLVSQFAPLANGYVLYDATNANSINVANSLCGPLNAVAVNASIESAARLFGVNNKVADVRARDEKWAWTNYPTLFGRSNVVELEEMFTEQTCSIKISD